MEEIYKICRVAKGNIWEVSNYGNMKYNGKEYIPTKGKHGYLRTYFNLVHRLVAELFVENDDPIHKTDVDHIDCNKLNNNANNLRWVSKSGNMMNPITRKHNSDSQKLYYSNDENRKKKSISSSKRYENNPELKKILSDKAKLKKGCKYLNDGHNQYLLPPEHWGEFLDIGFSFGKIK